MHGIFEEKIDRILIEIKKRGRSWRSIFLLDQYGYSAVTIRTLQNIFQNLPFAEVILTFAVDSLIDYMANSTECKNMLQNLGLAYDLSNLENDKQQKNWRSVIQFRLYRELVDNAGARYYTNFFIKSSESTRSYWLLHLSMHSKAKDEMQALHWSLENHFVSEGKAGLNMLAYDPKRDVDFTRQPSFFFNESDKEKNQKALLGQLPALIPSNGISVGEFYNIHCNQTTATFKMICSALQELYLHEEIEVRLMSGKSKKKGSKIDAHDFIKPASQLIFPFCSSH